MIKNPLYRLYYFAGGAFILALAKYFFVNEIEFLPKFFIVELISFGMFMTIVYLFDSFIRATNKEKGDEKKFLNQALKDNKQKIEELEATILTLKGDAERTEHGEEEMSVVSNQITKDLHEINSIEEFGKKLLNNLSKHYEIGLGVCYFYDKPSAKFSVKATYGLNDNIQPKDFVAGEGLNGQVVVDKKFMLIKDIDEEYFNIESCSGTSKPRNIYLLPIVKDNECIGLIEIANFSNVYIDKYWEQLNNNIVNSMSL